MECLFTQSTLIRIFAIAVLIFTGTIFLFGQHLDVEGDAKIRGYLDLESASDSSSMYIGHRTGIMISPGLERNTFVGKRAGEQNITGGFNSFFGYQTGRFSTGSFNSFFGSQSGRNNSGSFNSFFGQNSGFNNSSGEFNSFFGQNCGASNTTGTDNSFFGALAGNKNESGENNTFVGKNAGRENITGSDNSFFGKDAGENNKSQSNSFFGAFAGTENTFGENNCYFGKYAGWMGQTGEDNCFFGVESGSQNQGFSNSFFGRSAGRDNTTGQTNSFFGKQAGVFNTTGSNNVFIGEGAGDSNNSGNSNTFIGRGAGGFNRRGNFNTAVGDQANVTHDSLVNATALGYDAKVNDHNKVRIGNTSVRTIEGQVAFSFPSDQRVKENILPLDVGLSFILSLNPVSYHRIHNELPDKEMGFIAQELKESLQTFSSENYGMIQSGSDQLLTVRFNDLLAPMVKSIQELYEENVILKTRIESLENLMMELYKKTAHHSMENTALSTVKKLP